MKLFRFTATILGCSVITFVHAQSRQDFESDLLKSFKHLNYLILQKETDTTGAILDSLFADDFDSRFAAYLQKYPSSMKEPFDSLNNAGLGIADSDDGLVRFYTWDTGTGGQQKALSNVCQYQTEDGIKVVADIGIQSDDESAYNEGMYRFRSGDKFYYLTLWSNAVGVHDRLCGMMILAIEKGKLINDVKLIKTKSGLHGHVGCEYYIRDQGDYNAGINFDPTTKTVTLPLVDENYHLTDKSVVYKFTGRYFERVKN